MLFRSWDDALINAKKYDSVFNSLTSQKKEYLINTLNINPNNISYLKARALHNKYMFYEAIEFYNKIINDPKATGNKFAYYYYRALSYLALNNNKMAYIDLKISCNGRFELACSKLQLIDKY